MKAKLNTKLFLKALQRVVKAINKETALPILSNFLIETDDHGLIVLASDCSVFVSTRVQAKVNKSGMFTLPHDAIKFIERIKTEELEIHKVSSSKIEITDGDGKRGSYETQDPGNFPKTPEVKGKPSQITLERSVIKKLNLFVAKDNTRPMMMCININEDGEYCATDAHRLVTYGSGQKFPSSFRLMLKIENFLTAERNEGTVIINETHVELDLEDVKIIYRQVDGKYPNYKAVIPKSSNIKFTANRNELLNESETAELFANKITHQLKFTIDKEHARINAYNDIESKEYNGVVAGVGKGLDNMNILIGFNSKFLKSILKEIDSEKVTMQMTASNRCMVIKSDTYLYLLMPIMLND
jgi:DNA polymerase-3 subunit beta